MKQKTGGEEEPTGSLYHPVFAFLKLQDQLFYYNKTFNLLLS